MCTAADIYARLIGIGMTPFMACVAESLDFSVENVGLNEEHLRTLHLFKESPRGGKPWLR